MNLYKISQNEENGYDTYDSAVVAAESEEDARQIHPSRYIKTGEVWWDIDYEFHSSWASKLDQVTVVLIGTAVPETESGVICASFNAG